MIAGCYSLHLYCDNYDIDSVHRGEHAYDEFPHEYTDEFGSTCRRRARKEGWKFREDGNGVAICPKCVKRGLKLPPRTKL